jgi:hypothetical protein
VGALGFSALGLVGWLVPVVTGIPFYAAALVLLGLASARARAWINRAEGALPRRMRVGLRRGLRRIPSARVRRLGRLPNDPDPEGPGPGRGR